ncbi:MAG TPA: energy transducer TonB [Thermoanaerobaculia bacterium]|nr:energy transducer TonB [Thermoanaerobaculia bacterium]
MRHTITALVVLTLVACAAKEKLPPERLTLQRIERTFENRAGSEPERPAEGNVFVIVHLVEDPAREDNRDWIRSVMEDWDGRKYQPKSAWIGKGESQGADFFGRPVRIVKPDEIHVIFEVPQTAVMRSVTLPHPIPLFEQPKRIADPEMAPRVVHRVEPLYPEVAHWSRADGLVKLEVLIMPDGRVGGAQSIHGHPALGEVAAAAVRKWKYEPFLIDGKAVPALIRVHINFSADS